MKTKTVKKSELEGNWYIVDANDVRLGKLASNVASLLMGKGKVNFVRNLLVGDNVVVINAEKISVSANKKETKMYYKHTGYVGNMKEENLGSLLERRPQLVIEKAVKGMLPTNKLRDQMMTRLHIYAGTDHKHEAQQPEVFEIK